MLTSSCVDQDGVLHRSSFVPPKGAIVPSRLPPSGDAVRSRVGAARLTASYNFSAMTLSRFCLYIFLSIAPLGSLSLRAEALFPLRKDLAGGRTLPPPYSVGVNYVFQKQDYDLIQLSLASPLPLPPVGRLDAENETNYRQLRVGVWVLPFLQIYGVTAKVQTDTLVRAVPLLGDLRVKRKGDVLGFGTVLAAGRGRAFVTLNANHAKADLDAIENTIETTTVSPRVGGTFGWGRAWIGAMYQHMRQENHGLVTVPLLGGDVDYRSVLEASHPWNALAGVAVRMGRNWQLSIEGGFGLRRQWTSSLEFQW